MNWQPVKVLGYLVGAAVLLWIVLMAIRWLARGAM
jgi:hypothetical protein